MKRILLFLCCAAALSWSGCTKDGDDNTVDLTQLVGTWEVTKLYDGEFGIWFEEYGVQFGYVETLLFRDNGTGMFQTEETGANTWEEAFSYTVENNVITTKPANGNESSVYRVEKLTDSEMVLAIDYEGENGKPCTDKIYYKRISSLGSEGGDEGNDDNTIDPSQLIGTWELTQYYYGETGNWDNYGKEFGYISTIEFRTDGTARTHYAELESSYSSDGEYTYTLESNILICFDPKTSDYLDRAFIEKLNDSELILTYDDDGEDGKIYTDKEYYKRVN